MTRTPHVVLFAIVTALASQTAVAQFDLSWNTIDGGGATFSTGGTFSLGGTIGQPDAGAVMTGGTFTLTGGFWAGAASVVPPCEGDVDLDGDVDLTDLALLLTNFGTPSGAEHGDGDLDGDGDVDLTDLATLLTHFGTAC